jgi:hypothetical protein
MRRTLKYLTGIGWSSRLHQSSSTLIPLPSVLYRPLSELVRKEECCRHFENTYVVVEHEYIQVLIAI